MHTERSTKRRNAELIIGICILIYSLHIKRRNTMLMALHNLSTPFARKEERLLPLFHVHLLLLQYKNTPLLSSAAGVHGGVRNLRPHLLLFITSQVHYTRSTIQSLKIVTHEKTQRLIGSLMCHFTDGHAAVIAMIRNLSFLSSSHPCPCTQERGGPAISLLASFPSNPQGY